MKTFFPHLNLTLSACILIVAMSCQSDELANPSQPTLMEARSGSNSFLYPPTAHPFGQSYEGWAQALWETIIMYDCDLIFTPQVATLNENVSFFNFFVDNFTMDITVPREDALLLSVASALYDYPCPDAGFEPAEGQSLEAFLQQEVAGFIGLLENITVTFDGEVVESIEDYILISDLFYFTGNPELAECGADPCITGTSQPGVTGGYFIMFKKMQAGEHTITMYGEVPMYELTWDIQLNVTVE